jgi:hypothetical protein
MTGKSGRTRSRYTAPAAQSVAVDCSTFTDTASISSPNQAQIAKLGVGSVLGVELRANPQAVVATAGTAVVGGLVPVNLADLIACLKKKYRFSATVLRIDGAYCEVYIRCLGKG